MMIQKAIIFATLGCMLIFVACSTQTTTTFTLRNETKTTHAMITGIDQFDGGQVWGINTAKGTFVVGPEVPGGVKSTLYEHLIEAHESVVTIHYMEIPASKNIAAHKRIMSIIVQEIEYDLDY